MSTLKQCWDEYSAILDPGFSSHKVGELKLSFYAGMSKGILLCHQPRLGEWSVEKELAFRAAINDEVMEFAQEVMVDTEGKACGK